MSTDTAGRNSTASNKGYIMPKQDNLGQFYSERAELAYTIDHVPLGKTAYILERYATLEDDIEHLQADWAGLTLCCCDICGSHARTLMPGTRLCDVCTKLVAQGEITPPPPLLPWCSMCGRNDRALMPGQSVCPMCVGNLAMGAITPGEHAEAPQGQEITP